MRAYLDREQERRERLEQARQEYRDSLGDDCPHGPRVRRIGRNGDGYWAGLECPAGSPNCGISFISPARVFTEWRDQPVNPDAWREASGLSPVTVNRRFPVSGGLKVPV
jgi:hypothetical protein